MCVWGGGFRNCTISKDILGSGNGGLSLSPSLPQTCVFVNEFFTLYGSSCGLAGFGKLPPCQRALCWENVAAFPPLGLLQTSFPSKTINEPLKGHPGSSRTNSWAPCRSPLSVEKIGHLFLPFVSVSLLIREGNSPFFFLFPFQPLSAT